MEYLVKPPRRNLENTVIEARDPAPEHQRALERLLAGLDPETFLAQDGLGWVYQFWQTKKRKEVNDFAVKIGADELPAVTQLFTEPYMVSFLLDNSLGAWWVANHPDQPRPLEYLRHNKKPKLNIHWNKDRGKDVESAPWYRLGLEYAGKEGDRINHHHLRLAEKRTAHESLGEQPC